MLTSFSERASRHHIRDTGDRVTVVLPLCLWWGKGHSIVPEEQSMVV